MNNFELEKIVNKKLNTNQFDDFCPNGLQIEGRSKVNTIITGVTACQSLINTAIFHKVDGIIVHHGFFWKKDSRTIKGIHRIRIKSILIHDINLYSWHLPLDVHSKLGNNIQIGKILNIDIKGCIQPLVLWGTFKKPMSVKDMYTLLTKKFNRTPYYYSRNNSQGIYKIAWCSGKGQQFINSAAEFGVDTFLTGEVSEETIHYAAENKLHFFSIGHHASEICGIQALTTWLKNKFNLNIKFININNPI